MLKQKEQTIFSIKKLEIYIIYIAKYIQNISTTYSESMCSLSWYQEAARLRL